MLPEKLADIVITKLAETAAEALSPRLIPKEEGVHVVGVKNLQAHLRQHARSIERWATEISFRDLTKAKRLHESFVDLDLMVGDRRHSPEKDGAFHLHISDLISLRESLVVLGDPGAGKTTSLKRISLSVLHRQISGIGAFPLLLRLRDTPDQPSLALLILSRLGISLRFDSTVPKDDIPTLRQRYAIQLIDEQSLVVLIDGLDEMRPAAREGLVRELREFLLGCERARYIITCRTGDYRYHLENTTVMSLRPLSDEQIQEFAHRWLGARKAPLFLNELRKTPYSGSEVRPLNLAHLCAIYERSGTVPEKPRAVYRKIIRLMLEEWDEQRSVRRYSQYAKFEIDRKEDFLQALAYQLTTRHHTTRFTHYQLEEAYLHVYGSFGLPRDQVTSVVREIESHTGLILEVADEVFEFAHKSIQEFLTAAYIIKLPVPPSIVMRRLPNEAALVVALSSDPSEYLHLIAVTIEGVWAGFVEPFSHRLRSEKVDFTPSPQLAFDLLSMAHSAYTFASRADLPSVLPEPIEFIQLADLPAVRISLSQLLKGAQLVQGSMYCETTIYDPGRSKTVHLRIHPQILAVLGIPAPGILD